MNKELCEILNNYFVSDDNTILLRKLNELLYDGSYKNQLDWICMAISSSQMYGYLTYLTPEELEKFFESDIFRASSYAGNQIDFYNSGQLSLINEIELNKKLFISAPTSFGKTSLVNEYVLNNFNKLNNVVYIVPTNSLLEELFLKFSTYNKNLALNYIVSTQPIVEKSERNLLFLTPEKFLILAEEIDGDFFDLIVMDETYKIVDSKQILPTDMINSRSLRFRKVTELLGKSKTKIIFLSPFTYNTTSTMQKFLNKYSIVPLNRTIEYVSRKIFCVEKANEFKKAFNTTITGYKGPKYKKICYILNCIKNEKNIIYVGSYSTAYQIVDFYKVEYINSENDRFKKFIKHLEINYSLNNDYEWKIIEGLKKGIGIYISPMPRYIKKEIIKLYNENILKTLIVTTSFTEGVNTDACNLIFYTYTTGGTSNKLSDIDILNVSGRAGRFGKNSIGNIYCLDKYTENQILKLQAINNIKLENYNYAYDLKFRNYLEIEMMDEEYLNDRETNYKNELNKKIFELNLNKSDLNISLNVPNLWKIILFSALKNEKKEIIINLFNSAANIISNEDNLKCKSLENIFLYLKTTFENCSEFIEKENINLFSIKPYEISPFSNDNNFIWGAYYKLYLSGTTKQIINKNIDFVKSKYNDINKNHFTKKDILEKHLNKTNIKDYRWILNYYDKDLNINYDKFYSETFKFISNVIQYKIPFYVSFFTSILKLYLSKNPINGIEIAKLDIKKLIRHFEERDGDEDYLKLIDYGISNDLILKLKNNNIKYNDLRNNINNDILDG